MNRESIVIYMQKLGFSEVEVDIYFDLLSTGQSSISSLASRLGIPRTTVHRHVNKLCDRGVVAITASGGRRQFIGEDPYIIKTLIEEKISGLTKELQPFNLMASQVDDFVKSVYDYLPVVENAATTHIKHFTGKKNVLRAYKTMLQATDFYSFADYEKYYSIFPDTAYLWDEAYKKNKNRKVYDLVIDTPLAREIKKSAHERHYIKFMPEKMFFKDFSFADYIIFDQQLAFVELDSVNPSATILNSTQLAMTLKALHLSVWHFSS